MIIHDTAQLRASLTNAKKRLRSHSREALKVGREILERGVKIGKS
ncbi:hypothetical protein KOR42_33140 [Thalassoglobus neptunius]|uniref:Uncharacterized protein n=1 Tax=Thalassoglobus neptunius TaxID=1938619 RepID=A0A5C5WNX0_9PLAN|nr:hypothetical protein KOR42_33140 [Thalassoglobus neptunius]